MGTANAATGVADMAQVLKVMTEIAAALRRGGPPVIALRSTPPGSQIAGEVGVPLLRARAGRGWGHIGFVVNPEFLRERQRTRRLDGAADVIVGTDHAAAVAPIARALSRRRGTIPRDEPRHREPGSEYTANTFHARLKVAYADEVAAVAPAFGADGDRFDDAGTEEDGILNVLPAPTCGPATCSAARACPRTCGALNRGSEDGGAPVRRCSRRSWSPDAYILRRSVGVGDGDGHSVSSAPRVRASSRIVDAICARVALVDSLLSAWSGKEGSRRPSHDVPNVDPAALHGANLEFARGHLTHLTMLLRPTLAEAIPRGALVLLGKPVDPIALAEACADGNDRARPCAALPRDLPRLRVRRLEDPPPAGLP